MHMASYKIKFAINMDKLLKVDVTVDTDDYEEDVYRILQVIKPQWKRKNINIEVTFYIFYI